MSTGQTRAAVQLKCPFQCGGDMLPQHGKDAAMLLLNILVSRTSSIRHMMEGAGNSRINGQVQRCSGCGFIAIFA